MKQITKLILALGWFAVAIGVTGALNFVIKALTEPGWADEFRAIFAFTALLYSILIFLGIKLLKLRPIGRKLTLFLSPLFAFLVMGLIREIFVWKSVLGPNFAVIVDRFNILVFIAVVLFLLVFLNIPKVKEQFK